MGCAGDNGYAGSLGNAGEQLKNSMKCMIADLPKKIIGSDIVLIMEEQ